MNITRLEVTSGSPGGLAIGAVPQKKVEITYGQSLRITTSFNYRGPAVDITLYGAIGNRGWAGFDEIISAEATYKTPESRTTFVPVAATVDIPITADISPGTDYDIYCKIKDHPKAGYPQVDDIITITGIPPTFKLLEETIYPYAYVYDGPCEIFTFTFTTIPFTPASWISGRLATYCEEEVKKAGGRIMEMRVYVDESLWRPWTNWRIEIIGVRPKTAAGLGMPVGLAWWVGVILVILATIALIIVAYNFIIKPLTYTHKPISEEIKKTWAKPTLISVIGDFEAKLKLPPTPPSELEGMAEQELRDYCNRLAEEIAPPGVSWLPWAIGAGIGVLALGAVAVLASRKKG